MHATPSSGLRGIAVRSFECPASPVAVSGKPVRISAPQELLLCPLGLPGRASNPVRIAAGAQGFDVLVSALSRPDEPKPRDAVCPLYADLPQVVLARTGTHSYQVSIPTDGCGHYERAALQALTQARGA